LRNPHSSVSYNNETAENQDTVDSEPTNSDSDSDEESRRSAQSNDACLPNLLQQFQFHLIIYDEIHGLIGTETRPTKNYRTMLNQSTKGVVLVGLTGTVYPVFARYECQRLLHLLNPTVQDRMDPTWSHADLCRLLSCRLVSHKSAKNIPALEMLTILCPFSTEHQHQLTLLPRAALEAGTNTSYCFPLENESCTSSNSQLPTHAKRVSIRTRTNQPAATNNAPSKVSHSSRSYSTNDVVLKKFLDDTIKISSKLLVLQTLVCRFLKDYTDGEKLVVYTCHVTIVGYLQDMIQEALDETNKKQKQHNKLKLVLLSGSDDNKKTYTSTTKAPSIVQRTQLLDQFQNNKHLAIAIITPAFEVALSLSFIKMLVMLERT